MGGWNCSSRLCTSIFAKWENTGYYFFDPVNRTGVRVTLSHFPLPVLLPIIRPEASRCVPLNDPDELPRIAELPVKRPEESR
jgi:hypothetical protein